MDRSYRPLVITLVIVAILGLIAAVGLAFVVRSIITPKTAGVPVTIAAEVAPDGDGLRVQSTVTAVEGELPERVEVLTKIRNGYVRDPAGTIHVPSESSITDITVNGAPAQAGASVAGGGREITVAYVIQPDNTGALIGTIAAPISSVETRQLTVRSDGAAVCMQPLKDFVVSDPAHMITKTCDSPAVATPDPLEPDSTQPLPVWVRLHY